MQTCELWISNNSLSFHEKTQGLWPCRQLKQVKRTIGLKSLSIYGGQRRKKLRPWSVHSLKEKGSENITAFPSKSVRCSAFLPWKRNNCLHSIRCGSVLIVLWDRERRNMIPMWVYLQHPFFPLLNTLCISWATMTLVFTLMPYNSIFFLCTPLTQTSFGASFLFKKFIVHRKKPRSSEAPGFSGWDTIWGPSINIFEASQIFWCTVKAENY